MITELEIKTVSRSIDEIEFFDKVYIVFSDNEFYIHNGVDALVVLKGQFNYKVTPEQLLSNVSNEGKHILAVCDNIDIALDYYIEWLKETNKNGKN